MITNLDEDCVNVYVANLPQSADAKCIREMFSQAGKVLHVKLLLDIATGTSRGIAFVMFEDMTTARKACAMKNRTMCNGNVLQVRLAERSSQHQSPTSHTRSNVVYVRNVPAAVTSEQMKTFCSETFGKVTDVTAHPQSAEIGGPSPYNMLFVSFANVDDASIGTEEMDGKPTFPMPPNHPFTMAKMVTDVAGEMRKSILLRRRSSDGSTGSPQNVSPQVQNFQAMNMVPFAQQMQPLTVDAVNAIQQQQQIPHAQRRVSQTSTDSFGVQVQPVMMASPQRRLSNGSVSSAHSDARSPLELAAQLPPTAFIPVVYSTPQELPQSNMAGVGLPQAVHQQMHAQSVQQQQQQQQPQQVVIVQQPMLYTHQPAPQNGQPQMFIQRQ